MKDFLRFSSLPRASFDPGVAEAVAGDDVSCDGYPPCRLLLSLGYALGYENVHDPVT